MAEILSGARKYRIGLTLAHHELHQLERDKEVASAVMTHPYTRIVFRVGDDDARKFADGFSFFEAKDLRSLETGNAVCRVERADYDFNLAVPLIEESDAAGARARRLEVIEASRKTHGTPRAEIEAFLAESMVGTQKRAIPPRTQARPESVKESHAGAPLAPGLKPESKPPGVVEDATTEEVAPPVTRLPAAEETRVADKKLHLAIKEEIGRAAEALSYTVTYEEKVADGGRIDVVLRRGRRSIACEVSVVGAGWSGARLMRQAVPHLREKELPMPARTKARSLPLPRAVSRHKGSSEIPAQNGGTERTSSRRVSRIRRIPKTLGGIVADQHGTPAAGRIIAGMILD